MLSDIIVNRAMLQYLDPVPFTIDNDTHFGLSETQGLLSSDGNSLVIEFRIADTISGALKTATRQCIVPLGEVQSIRFQKKMFGFTSSVTLRTRNQQVLEALPESKMGTVNMHIRRRDRADAEAFCMAVQEAVLRTRTRLIEDDLNQIEGG